MELRNQIHVVATTEEGTRGALLQASELVGHVHPVRVVLLVPRFMPSRQSNDDPGVLADITEEHRRLASNAGLTATVRLCVCRRYTEIFRWMLGKRATVVVGGRRRWWWPTTEQQIARSLRRAGHTVVFADVGLR